jgi:uncharacterized protein YjiS (DUF1127 family)
MAIHSNTDPPGGSGAARPRPIARARHAVSSWLGRERDRRALAALDDRELKDIGLARCDIAAASARWRSRG